MTPASFSHPLLVAQKAVAQPIAAEEPKPDALPAVKSEKASDAGLTNKPAFAEASLELRPSVGHDDGVKPVMAELSAPMPLREQTRTADASSALPATNASATMTDATSSGSNPSPKAEPTETKSSEAATVDIKPAGTEASAHEAAKTEQHPDKMKADARSDDIKPEASKTDAPKSIEGSNEKPAESVKAATDVPSVAEVKKDQDLPNSGKAAVSKPAPAIAAAPKGSGQISVFVSRKDSKLYVRQNFAPLFNVPVTIAPSDRPLGTHVFTAQADKNDANILHWSVVSLPVRVRYAEWRDEDERGLRRRKAGAVEMKSAPVPDSPAEALDRLTIPADAMARITEALSTGGSIIVSDQGINAGETGEGTDFIVSLR
jgi:hypothetical protein